MPNYKGHLAGGIFAYLLAIYFVLSHQSITLITGAEWLLFTLAGSLFPDVDVKSKGQKLFYWITLLLALILLLSDRIQALIILGFICVVPLLVNHRGIFHRLWFVILVPSFLAMFLCSYLPGCSRIIIFDTIFFVVGAVSHLWLDLGLRRMLRL
jgi:hypothetical protein